MTRLMLKEIPRYECLREVATKFPQLNPTAMECFMYMMRAGDEMFRVGDAYFSKHNLSQGRFLVLILLVDPLTSEAIARTPAELADMASCTRATMTGLIDTLERDGLVRREPNPDDRRMMRVYITEQGLSVLETILPEHFARITQLMAPLSEAECRTLVGLLSKVIVRAGELDPLV